MEHVLSDKTKGKFAEYARNVWGLQGEDEMALAKEAIACTKKFFFETLEIPSSLKEVGIEDDRHFEVMAEKAAAGCEGCYVPLSKEDIISIFNQAL